MKKLFLLIPLMSIAALAGCAGQGGSTTSGSTTGSSTSAHVHSYDPVTGDCSCGDHQHVWSTSWAMDSFKHWHAPTCAHAGELENHDVAEHTFDSNGICTECSYNGGAPLSFKGNPYTPVNISLREVFDSSIGTHVEHHFEKIGNNMLIYTGNEYTYCHFVDSKHYLAFSKVGEGDWSRLGPITMRGIYNGSALYTLWDYVIEGSPYNHSTLTDSGEKETLQGMECSIFTGTNQAGVECKYWVALTQKLVLKIHEGNVEANSTTAIQGVNTSITAFSIAVPVVE